MLNKRIFLVLATLSAILLVGLGITRGAAALLAAPNATAVVNLQAVFDRAAIRGQFKADQQQKAEQLQVIQKEKQNALSVMEQDLKVLQPGSDAYIELQDQLQMKVLEFRIWGEFENAKLVKEQGLQLERLYRDALGVIASLAQEQGYAIVLYKETDPPVFRWDNPQQLSGQIQLRKVLYSSDEIDITDAVVTRLNNEHNAG